MCVCVRVRGGGGCRHTCRFIRRSPSDLGHHQSGHLSGELQEVGELFMHGAWRSIPEHLSQKKIK